MKSNTDVIEFKVKSVSEIEGLPCMKNIGLVIATAMVSENGEYGYFDANTKQKYLIRLVK